MQSAGRPFVVGQVKVVQVATSSSCFEDLLGDSAQDQAEWGGLPPDPTPEGQVVVTHHGRAVLPHRGVLLSRGARRPEKHLRVRCPAS